MDDASETIPIPSLGTAATPVRWCPTCSSPFRADFARCPIDGTEIIATSTDLLIGKTLGAHYVVDALIGEGTMARVYRAHHAMLPQKNFAVKVMIGDLTATLEMRMRFTAEANAASQLEHANVVSVLDFGKTEHGLMYLVMELFEGESLASLIGEEAPLPVARALTLARQICLGLGHAHERGLVHRDLKPDNIMIVKGPPEHARIVDFGLAIPIDEERSTRLTHVGLMVGTPVYASPEQTHNETVDHRSDLFALGVTMYEMLAGVTPYRGGLAQLIQQNASDVLVPIAARSEARVPEEVEAIVRKLMRRDPDNRFANAREVIAAIDEAARATTQHAGVAMSMVVLPAKRKRGPWIAIGAAAAVAFVATFVVLTWPSTQPKPEVASSAPVKVPVTPTPTPTPAPALAPTGDPASLDPMPAPVEIPKPIATKPKLKTKPVIVATTEPSPVETKPEPHVNVVIPTPVPRPDAGVAVLVPTPVMPVAPPVQPLLTTARTVIAALTVRGPLSDADVRRAVERGFPAMRACYQTAARAKNKSPSATVRLQLSFDDSRRASVASAVAAGWPELAACVRTAADDLRVQVAPDVGTADVVVDVAFQPVSP